jgi:hypothetical protein
MYGPGLRIGCCPQEKNPSVRNQSEEAKINLLLKEEQPGNPMLQGSKKCSDV